MSLACVHAVIGEVGGSAAMRACATDTSRCSEERNGRGAFQNSSLFCAGRFPLASPKQSHCGPSDEDDEFAVNCLKADTKIKPRQ